MTNEMNQKDEMLQDTVRQLELQKIGLPGPSGKRARNDDNDDETFSGFSVNKEIATEIIHQAVLPFMDTLKTFQRQLDDQATVLSELRRTIQARPITQVQIPVIPELRIPTTPRNVPTPRITKSRLSKKDEARIKTLSYAQALALAPMPADNIRNISIKGESQEAEKIASTLRKDNLFSDMPINSINAKGLTNLTYKCDDSDTAKAIAEKLQEKYNGKITVSPVKPTLPQLKITKLYTDEIHAEVIMSQICESNPIFDQVEYTIEQFYETTPSRGEPFKNIVISTSLEHHTQLLNRGRIIFNMAQARIYEYINILMCARCLRYGHFARTCTFIPSCKRCGLNHPTSECIATEPSKNLKCINCISSNKRGKNY